MAEVRAIADPECDLVIRGGTVVTAGSSAECDVGIAAGRISQLGGQLRGRRELDASGALVLPGGLDMHVHLSSPDPPEAASLSGLTISAAVRAPPSRAA